MFIKIQKATKILISTNCIIVVLPNLASSWFFTLAVHMIKFDPIESIISNHVRQYTENLKS